MSAGPIAYMFENNHEYRSFRENLILEGKFRETNSKNRETHIVHLGVSVNKLYACTSLFEDNGMNESLDDLELKRIVGLDHLVFKFYSNIRRFGIRYSNNELAYYDMTDNTSGYTSWEKWFQVVHALAYKNKLILEDRANFGTDEMTYFTQQQPEPFAASRKSIVFPPVQTIPEKKPESILKIRHESIKQVIPAPSQKISSDNHDDENTLSTDGYTSTDELLISSTTSESSHNTSSASTVFNTIPSGATYSDMTSTIEEKPRKQIPKVQSQHATESQQPVSKQIGKVKSQHATESPPGSKRVRQVESQHATDSPLGSRPSVMSATSATSRSHQWLEEHVRQKKVIPGFQEWYDEYSDPRLTTRDKLAPYYPRASETTTSILRPDSTQRKEKQTHQAGGDCQCKKVVGHFEREIGYERRHPLDLELRPVFSMFYINNLWRHDNGVSDVRTSISDMHLPLRDLDCSSGYVQIWRNSYLDWEFLPDGNLPRRCVSLPCILCGEAKFLSNFSLPNVEKFWSRVCHESLDEIKLKNLLHKTRRLVNPNLSFVSMTYSNNPINLARGLTMYQDTLEGSRKEYLKIAAQEGGFAKRVAFIEHTVVKENMMDRILHRWQDKTEKNIKEKNRHLATKHAQGRMPSFFGQSRKRSPSVLHLLNEAASMTSSLENSDSETTNSEQTRDTDEHDISSSPLKEKSTIRGLISKMRFAKKWKIKTRSLGLQYVSPTWFMIPTEQIINEMLRLSRFSVIEVAQELAVVDKEFFLMVTANEILDCAWVGKHKVQKAPHITSIIDYFKRLLNLIVTDIICESTTEARVSIVCFYIDVAHLSLKLRNYHSMTAVLTSLRVPPIFRLDSTWQHIEKEMPEHYLLYMDLSDVMMGILEEDAGIPPDEPCLSFFGSILQSLLAVDTERAPLHYDDRCGIHHELNSLFRKVLLGHQKAALLYDTEESNAAVRYALFAGDILLEPETYWLSREREPHKSHVSLQPGFSLIDFMLGYSNNCIAATVAEKYKTQSISNAKLPIPNL